MLWVSNAEIQPQWYVVSRWRSLRLLHKFHYALTLGQWNFASSIDACKKSEREAHVLKSA